MNAALHRALGMALVLWGKWAWAVVLAAGLGVIILGAIATLRWSGYG